MKFNGIIYGYHPELESQLIIKTLSILVNVVLNSPSKTLGIGNRLNELKVNDTTFEISYKLSIYLIWVDFSVMFIFTHKNRLLGFTIIGLIATFFMSFQCLIGVLMAWKMC